MQEDPKTRLTGVLKALGIPTSTWYRPAIAPEEKKRPGPEPKAMCPQVEGWVKAMAEENPWYGYQRIAVMCRREDQAVKDREAYAVMKAHDLLQKPKCRVAEAYQASKLYELLPHGPNELWQMDVTYVHIPGYDWWYAVTVIDYYSRYLLAAELTHSYSAASVIEALGVARKAAEKQCGPLEAPPVLVTDNGTSFTAKRFSDYVKNRYNHQRIQYRTPTQLGLLERFHRTLKEEEIYWRLYDNPAHGRACIKEFQNRYNEKRPHWALRPAGGGDPVTPQDVYIHGIDVGIPKWQAWAKEAKKKLDALLAEAA